MNKNAKMGGNAWIWIVVVVVALFVFGVVKLPTLGQGTGTGGDKVIATYAADAAYATQDKFSSTAITGTAYYAEDDKIFQSTAPKLERDVKYTYWLSNGTNFYVKPITFTASGSNNVINKEAFKNGSATITAYDVVNNCNVNRNVLTNTCNVSLGANEEAKLDIKYLGGAKTANLPFGGVMVVEYNATVPTQTCSGDGIVGLNSKYAVTYSNSATSNTHKIYEVADGFDISATGTTGVSKVIRCEFVNGATAAAAGSIKVTFIPANFYLGNDGKLYLDVEQVKNGATTRTGFTNGDLTELLYTQ